MFVGMIKKNVRQAINELFAEGIVHDVITKTAESLKALPNDTIKMVLSNLAKYVDDVTIDASDKKVVIKFRKEF